MDYILILLGFLLLCYFIWNYIYIYSDISYIKSDIDDRTYMIRRGHNKSPIFFKQSANTLAEINKRVEKLIEHLEYNFKNDNERNYFIRKLRKGYNPYMISEAEVDIRYTTYTVDKKDMHICLRTRDKEENIYDINILMYVVIHELAHLCNYSKSGDPILGHGNEFLMIFKFLVEESLKCNVYKYEDYNLNPQSYCGLILSSQILG